LKHIQLITDGACLGNPGPGGWAADGSNWGEQYLKGFYNTMKNRHPDKIAIGGAWPGFDDSAAKWGLNRHIRRGCGKTLDETMSIYRQYYDSSNPLPFLMIETWNDYEEGTAIERQPAANCGVGANLSSAQPPRAEQAKVLSVTTR